MPQYVGFSTINANKPKSTGLASGSAGGFGSTVNPIVFGKKFRLVDEQLVIQDLINAFNIKQGEKPGQPQYGTTLWSFIFEPNTADVRDKLEAEVRRVAGLDPRLQLNTVTVYSRDNGILIEVEMAVTPFNQARLLNIFFNSQTNLASLSA